MELFAMEVSISFCAVTFEAMGVVTNQFSDFSFLGCGMTPTVLSRCQKLKMTEENLELQKTDVLHTFYILWLWCFILAFYVIS